MKSKLSDELIKKFEDEDYILVFENDAMLSFEVPHLEKSGLSGSWRIYVLTFSRYRGKVVISFTDKVTSEDKILPDKIFDLVYDAIRELGWEVNE